MRSGRASKASVCHLFNAVRCQWLSLAGFGKTPSACIRHALTGCLPF